MSTRRQFFRLSSALLCATTLPGVLFAEEDDVRFSSAGLGAYAQGLLVAASFEKVIGSTFRAKLPGYSYADLRLASVQVFQPAKPTVEAKPALRGSKPAAPGATMTSFLLQFTRTAALEQDSYVIDHGTLGMFTAFLVPGEEAGLLTCSAVFNYLN